MELRQIRYFITVAETKSLSRAIEKLHIAQPALSQNIKNLEEELGSKLFNRSHQGMELTGTGQLFLNHAYAIMQEVNKAKEVVAEEEENPSGRIFLGMAMSVSNVLSVPLYKLIREKYPNIELHLEYGLSGNMINAFQSGALDLLICPGIEKTQGGEIEKLMREEYYLVTRNVPGSGKDTEIEFSQLPHYPLLISGPQHDVAQMLQKHALKHDITLNILQGAGGLQPTLRLIREGIGNCVLPWAAIYDQAEEKQLNAVKIIKPKLERTTSLIYPADRLQSNACKKVVKAIIQVTKQLHANHTWRGKLLTD